MIDPSSLPAGSLFSFAAPCLKWKLLAAFKTHFGIPGFLTSTRYLQKTITETYIEARGQPPATSSRGQSVLTINRFSGAQTKVGATAEGPEYFKPVFGFVVTTQVLSDSHSVYTATLPLGSLGYETWTWDTTLSQPYPLDQLEADADSLIDAVNLDSIPARTFTPFYFPGDDTIAARDAMNLLIPTPWNYPGQFGASGVSINAAYLRSAAISAYNPNLCLDFGEFGLVKMCGWIAMAGAYCATTHFIDYSQQPCAPTLAASGRGNCSDYFKISPPALNPACNSYTTLQAAT